MKKMFGSVLWLYLLFCHSMLQADDIDLFKSGGSRDPSPPNVLIFLDNTSNWSANSQAWNKTEVNAKCSGDPICQGYVTQIFGSNNTLTQGQVEVSALKLVLNELACNVSSDKAMKVNVGILMIKPEKGAYANNAGTLTNTSEIAGFVRGAVLPLDSTHCANLISALDTIFNNITSPTYKTPANANYGGPLFDAFKYFGGHTSPALAAAGTAATPTGHIGYGPLRFGLAESEDDPNAFSDPTTRLSYKSPITAITQTSCGYNNYLLLVGNTYPNADNLNLLNGLGYSYTPASFAFTDRTGDVWARFLATTDVSPVAGQQGVRTSVMNIFNASASADQTKLLKSMAKYGQGAYYEVGGSLGGLINSFKNFFTLINDTNQSFVPAALPAGISPYSPALNQVYLGMFRPDKNPRWFGNLKLYRYVIAGTDANGEPNVVLADSNGAAIAGNTSLISDTAVSYWTQTSSFWDYRCGSGNTTGDNILCGDPISISDSPDGAVVEKGAAAQKLRLTFTADATNSARKVYSDNGSSRIDFNATSITTTQLGVATTAERDAIVNWVRGVDNIGENTSVSNGPRPSIVGDVLHSEPVAVNYGLAGGGCGNPSSADVVVYYAGNDGFLHAVQGGTTGGSELWSYIPANFLGQMKRLYNNAPAVTYPAPVPPTEFNKPYMIDGSLSVYAPDADANCVPDKVWLFLTMRRGGRFIYALDVTSKTDPVLLWKKSYADSGYTELGQSWSKLRPILLPDNKPYLIFGAGYDPSAEDRPFNTATGTYGNPVTTTRSMGRGVFIVDAQTGTVKHFLKAGNYSIPSEVAVVSDFNTGIAQRAYVGDTGGDLWKIMLPTSVAEMDDGSKWGIAKVATLGVNDASGGNVARSFLYPPDIVRCSRKTVLLIGSGDREKPFDTVTQNRLFMLQDDKLLSVVAGNEVDSGDLTDVTTNGTLVSSEYGWYINLEAGEKTVGTASTLSGQTYFPIHKAADNTGSDCSATLGTARVYGVKCSDGAGTYTNGSKYENQPAGVVFPPPITTRQVLIEGTNGQPSTTVTITSSGTKQIDDIPRNTKRKFIYSYREGLD